MRIFAALCLCLLVCAPASAQDASLGDPAARRTFAETVATLMLDADVMNQAVDAAAGSSQQRVREAFVGPMYDSLRPEHKRALDQFAERMPTLIREETLRVAPMIRDEFAARLADEYSEDQLRALAQFQSTMAERGLLARAVRAGADFQSMDLPAEDRLALETAFAETRERMPPALGVTRLLGQANRDVQARTRPALQRRIANDLCTALEDECPARVRQFLDQPPADATVPPPD